MESVILREEIESENTNRCECYPILKRITKFKERFVPLFAKKCKFQMLFKPPIPKVGRAKSRNPEKSSVIRCTFDVSALGKFSKFELRYF